MTRTSTSVFDEPFDAELLNYVVVDNEDSTFTVLIRSELEIITAGLLYSSVTAHTWARQCICNLRKGIEEPPDALDWKN